MMDLRRFQLHLCCVFAACVIYVHFNSLVSAAPEISSELQATLYLQKYGYVNESMSNLSSFLSQKEGHMAIKEFQRFAGLPETGKLDKKTLAKMNMPRCGVRDRHNGSDRRKRYALQGSKWMDWTDLNYRITKYPQRLDWRAVDKEIAKAFKVWSDVTNLNFFKTDRGRINIDIRFVEGEHDDGYGFDGPGGVLAHAFFPQHGGVHFDDTETWTIKEHGGIDLLQVAVHEFGHALGLDHSDVQTAVMKPFYSEYEPSFSLDKDDILGIQALYGRKEAVAEIPDLCQDASIDTATITEDGRTYVFKGDYYFELTGGDRIADGYPRKISEDWDGLPGKLDAALPWEDGKTYFFKRNQYWSFRNKKMDSGYPREISDWWPGIPNNIDAALLWSENGKAYFFKGSNYWRYVDPSEPNNGVGYPQPISGWTGLPDNIDAALGWNKQYSYFFKGTGYYRFDNKLSKVSTDNGAYPFSTSQFWFGC